MQDFQHLLGAVVRCIARLCQEHDLYAVAIEVAVELVGLRVGRVDDAHAVLTVDQLQLAAGAESEPVACHHTQGGVEDAGATFPETTPREAFLMAAHSEFAVSPMRGFLRAGRRVVTLLLALCDVLLMVIP